MTAHKTCRILWQRYELPIMKSVSLSFLLLFSTLTMATSLIKTVALTPLSAKALGFTVSAYIEGPSIQVRLKGPIKNVDSCYAARSGTFLLDSNDQELMLHITELPHSQEQPEALGYYINNTHSMGVFLDYICPLNVSRGSKRYTVLSIGDWLITSK